MNRRSVFIVLLTILLISTLSSTVQAMYSPKQGRFLQRDPIGYQDGMNLYRAHFIPAGTDPAGLSPSWIVAGIDGTSSSSWLDQPTDNMRYNSHVKNFVQDATGEQKAYAHGQEGPLGNLGNGRAISPAQVPPARTTT